MKLDIYKTCSDDPSAIFHYIKLGEFEIVKELIDNNTVSCNTVDGIGNNLVMRLLKVHEYDLVLSLMKKRNWDVNHQNDNGDTFGHILALDNNIGAVKVMEQLKNKKNYVPNIKNNNGETALDIALNNDYLYAAFKILEDKRFDNIDVFSFRNLFNACIKNTLYGKYSKLTNLEVIVDSLEKKDLNPTMRDLITKILDNMETIKWEIMNNSFKVLESIINMHVEYNY